MRSSAGCRLSDKWRQSINTKLTWARRVFVTLVGSVGLVAAAAGTSSAIVGGQIATSTDAPYIVAVLNNGELICGATQLNADTLITAAHCFPTGQRQNLTIRIGSLNSNSGGTVLPVSNVFVNPGYNSDTMENDIAILRTAGNMPGVTPIALPAEGDDPLAGSDIRVSGWGATEEGGATRVRLRTAILPVVSRDVCATNYANFQNISPNMFCAGTAAVDACQGDSGGPAIAFNLQGARVLEGVVSFGEGCAREARPGVFTRTSTYLDWIRANE